MKQLRPLKAGQAVIVSAKRDYVVVGDHVEVYPEGVGHTALAFQEQYPGAKVTPIVDIPLQDLEALLVELELAHR